MPNQRSREKTYLGGFVEKELHHKIVKLANAAGMGHNKFGFVTQLIEKALKRRKGRKPARAKA